jgi:hypothetical protein
MGCDDEAAAWAHTGWTLSGDARAILKEWVHWSMQGEMEGDGFIAEFRKSLAPEGHL